MKLVMGLYLGSLTVVKLELGLHQGCSLGSKRYPGVVKLMIGLHHQRCKKVKFIKGTSPWEFQGA